MIVRTPSRWVFSVVGSVLLTAAGCAGQSAFLTKTLSQFRAANPLAPTKFNKESHDGDGRLKLHLRYAQWQEQLGHIDEARKSYGIILKEEPNSADAIAGLARLDQLAGRMELAERGFQKALEIEPQNAQILDSVGKFYIEQQRWKDAVRVLNDAALSAPDDKLIRNHLAVALAKSGATESALPLFVKSVGRAQAHYNLGVILYEQGQISASEKHFLKALLQEPKLEQAQYWLNEVRRELGVKPQIAVVQEQQLATPQHSQPADIPALASPKQDGHSPNIPANWSPSVTSESSSNNTASHWTSTRHSDKCMPNSTQGRSAPQFEATPASTLSPEQLEQRKNQQ